MPRWPRPRGLVRHDVAPVASRVPDAEEDRDVTTPRLGERLLAPRPPVHRVVLVLQQVGAGRVRQAVDHLPTLGRSGYLISTAWWNVPRFSNGCCGVSIAPAVVMLFASSDMGLRQC